MVLSGGLSGVFVEFCLVLLSCVEFCRVLSCQVFFFDFCRAFSCQVLLSFEFCLVRWFKGGFVRWFCPVLSSLVKSSKV